MNVNTKNAARLPRCVHKYDLKTYFGCNYKLLWRNVITKQLLEGWGIDLEEFKQWHILPPDVTLKIYIHFGITDLDANLSKQVAEAIGEVES